MESGPEAPDLESTLRRLEESERRYREVFETNSAPKLIIDPETGSILDANAAAAQFYGCTLEDLQDLRIQDINVMPPQRIEEEMERARSEKRLYFRFQHRLASGEVRDVDVYSGPVSVEGRTLLHSIVIDVTEKRRLERQLLRAQRMDTIGQLAGGVAHDFNNALTVILGCSELGRDSVPEDHAARDYFDEIIEVAHRTADVTRQLLALARKQVVQPRTVYPHEVVFATDKLLRRLIGEDIEMVTLVADDPWPVYVDPGQLQQLLVNLAVNARDAMAGGGKLTIETFGVDVDAAAAEARGVDPGRWVVLRVTDTGVGMSPEILERIFDPFFTTKDRGTGLGLATCQAIVEHAGGRVVVKSEPGVGSTFEVHLPATTAERGAPVREPSAESPGGSETILVVEDETMVRRLLVTTLRARGYHIVAAAHGDEALRVADAHEGPLDLLIADVVMPMMSGVDLARRLRERRPALPVLFVSGYPAGLVDPGELGVVTAFLAKPFLPAELAREVRALLDTVAREREAPRGGSAPAPTRPR